MKQILYISILSLNFYTASAQIQFTYNEKILCEKSKVKLQEDVNYESFLNSQILPALRYFNEQNEAEKYLAVCKCSNIESILYSLKLYSDKNQNFIKQEAKVEFEKNHLSFLRKNHNEEWSNFFYKKILADLNMIYLATQLSNRISNNLGTEKEPLFHVNNLKKEIILNMETDIKHASKNCILFENDKKEKYNEYIRELSSTKPLLGIYSCH